MCECDGNLSPLPLDSHKKENILNGFENMEFENENSDVQMEINEKENFNFGNLEFYQNDKITLNAYCDYCGFNEKVL